MLAYIIASLIFIIIVATILYVREYALERMAKALRAFEVPKRLNKFGNEAIIYTQRMISTLPKSMSEYQQNINSWITKVAKTNEFGTNNIQEVCAYALSSGKRLRPIIAMEIGRACAFNSGMREINLIEMALAIEYIHNSSLIIDDMEWFDNDDYRRGNLTVHRKYGPARAQMSSLVLLVGAFQNLARQMDELKNTVFNFNITNIVNFINFFVNHQIQETAIGQLIDLENKAKPTREDIFNLIQRKTGTLFEISTVCGWVFSGGEFKQSIISDIKKIGTHVAIALQIADDIGDMEKDASLGQQFNYANNYGADESIKEIELQLNICEKLLRRYNLFTDVWNEIFAAIFKMF